MGSRELLFRVPMGKVFVNIASTNLTTTDWTTLIDPLPAACVAISIAYTGDAVLKLAKGAAAAEVELPLYVTPGQAAGHPIPLELAKGIRLSAKCEDQNTAVGRLVINLYG